MHKRKASQSVDAWLLEGEEFLQASRTSKINECQVKARRLEPTADLVPVEVTPSIGDQPAATTETASRVTTCEEGAAQADEEPPVHVATNEELAATWFWDLLTQCGYEGW